MAFPLLKKARRKKNHSQETLCMHRELLLIFLKPTDFVSLKSGNKLNLWWSLENVLNQHYFCENCLLTYFFLPFCRQGSKKKNLPSKTKSWNHRLSMLTSIRNRRVSIASSMHETHPLFFHQNQNQNLLLRYCWHEYREPTWLVYRKSPAYNTHTTLTDSNLPWNRFLSTAIRWQMVLAGFTNNTRECSLNFEFTRLFHFFPI